MTPLRLDGNDVVALRARRENFNAHGFDIVSFYVVSRNVGKQAFDIIPLFADDGKSREELHEISVGGGADCNLDDFRLVAAQGRQPARLVVAHRDFGDSYAASALVHFTYYDLMRNEEEAPGEPALYFEQKGRSSSRQKYCDVNEAFERELHMGKSGGRHNELHFSE